MSDLKNIFICVFLLFSSNLYAGPQINAKTFILIDYDSNEVIYELDPDISIYPASMTKIMTSIVAFDLLAKNKISLDDETIISEKAWRMSQSGYSSMFIMINDTVTIGDLLKGIIIVSGNDACVALAEAIAGTEENFSEMMNDKAKEIGMTNTSFVNSSGINDPDNYSTVRDIALMSKYLIENYPQYYHLYAEKEFTWDKTGGEPIKQNNRNGLLYKNIGADGIKTGYLAVEKYSLASTIKKNDRRLISVGSGFNTKLDRTNESIKLLSWGFRNTVTYEISKKNHTTFEIKTWLGKKNLVKGVTKDNLYLTLKKKEDRDLNIILEYDGPIKAPITIGEKIAKINVFKRDELIKSIPIYASEDIEKINFIKSVFTSLNYLIWGDV